MSKCSLLSQCDGELMFSSPTDKVVIRMPNDVKVRLSVSTDGTLTINAWKIICKNSNLSIRHFSSVTVDSFPTIKVKL